jgi:hypothetical protein
MAVKSPQIRGCDERNDCGGERMWMMKILIACEFSGTVTAAFRALGHSAWSCDLLPAEREDMKLYHIQGDCMGAIKEGRPTDGAKWDMMIAHPPCTYLCSSGLHWNKRVPERQEETEKALSFVASLLNADIPRIALENPVGCISTRIRKYDQKIQPWQFGHDASKGTCLWLKGLRPLRHTCILPPAGWGLVKCAGDCIPCPDCGEPYCAEHEEHYADCACIGPTQDEATYKTIDGYDFATLDPSPKKPVWGNQTPSGQNNLGPSADRWKERSKTYQGIADAMADQWGGQQ